MTNSESQEVCRFQVSNLNAKISQKMPRKPKKLIPWIEHLLETKKYKDFAWVNQDEGLFRVPWPRQKDRVWKEEHSAFYLDYVQMQGRKNEGKPDYVKWKARLRTALHKDSSIEEVLRREEKGLRYYRFLHYSGSSSSCSTSGSDSDHSPLASPMSDHQNEYLSFEVDPHLVTHEYTECDPEEHQLQTDTDAGGDESLPMDESVELPSSVLQVSFDSSHYYEGPMSPCLNLKDNFPDLVTEFENDFFLGLEELSSEMVERVDNTDGESLATEKLPPKNDDEAQSAVENLPFFGVNEKLV